MKFCLPSTYYLPPTMACSNWLVTTGEHPVYGLYALGRSNNRTFIIKRSHNGGSIFLFRYYNDSIVLQMLKQVTRVRKAFNYEWKLLWISPITKRNDFKEVFGQRLILFGKNLFAPRTAHSSFECVTFKFPYFFYFFSSDIRRHAWVCKILGKQMHFHLPTRCMM